MNSCLMAKSKLMNLILADIAKENAAGPARLRRSGGALQIRFLSSGYSNVTALSRSMSFPMLALKLY